MPVFEYVGLAGSGKSVKGSVDADNSRAARQKLKTQGVYTTSLTEVKEAAASPTKKDILGGILANRVSTKLLSVSTRQLATLVAAGIPLVESLQSLIEQTEHKHLRRVFIDIREAVEAGSALAKALSAHPKVFPPLFINMVASGESSGSLDAVLNNLAEYLEAQLALQRKISTALFYPALMLVFCLLVVLFLFTKVVPSIVDVFIRQGRPLPIPTRITMAISNAITGYSYLIVIVIVAIIASARWYLRQESGRALFDRFMLNSPLIGGLYRRLCTARFAKTLSALLNSGVGLLEDLDITKNVISNSLIKAALEEARDGVREGKSLAREISKSKIFPIMLSQMIAVGERSGSLENMLERAGISYEQEVNATLEGLTSLIEPLMIIGLGGIVLAIVASVLLPMLGLMEIVQG